MKVDLDENHIPNSRPTSVGVSLQDSFEKFRKQRSEEIKLCMFKNSEGNGKVCTDEYKRDIRLKFVDTAKKYLGVPYHKKYADPSIKFPDGLDGVYLDCCGLVRQSVRDMRSDFDFLIGNWNQAYQFDISPKSIQENELQFGDLIFYEGNYLSKRSKLQKHNIVHVEIFIGGETGEATIGARYQSGVIQIFPSYKFNSTKWSLVQYHFKSLDPWIEGRSSSCCLEHKWQAPEMELYIASGKRSIFAPTFETEEFEAAEEDLVEDGQAPELEVGPAGGIALTAGESSTDEAPNGSSSEATSSTISGTGKENLKPPRPKRLSKALDPKPPGTSTSSPLRGSTGTLPAASAGGAKKAPSPLTYYVLKSNGWKLVKAALDRRGWQQLPFDYNFTTRFNLKWVERRSQIDYKAHLPGQLVNHIPNNEVITTKIGLVETMRDFYCRPKATPGQVTQVMNEFCLPWLPETYLLDSPSDCQAMLKSEEDICATTGQEGVWIYKPASSNRGRGLKVMRGKTDLQAICKLDRNTCPAATGHMNGDSGTIPRQRQFQVSGIGIVQRYIERPLLANRFKFDLRCYMLVACNEPKYVVYYHRGYCRLSLQPYSTSVSLDDTFVHLTNASIQKKHPNYESNKDHQIKSPSMVAAIISADGDEDSAKYITSHMDHEIKLCMVAVIKAAMSKLHRRKGYFDLFGLDFMVELTDGTQRQKLILLEVNTNPALSLDNKVLEDLLPGMVDGCLGLVLRHQGPKDQEAHNPSQLISSVSVNGITGNTSGQSISTADAYEASFDLLLNELSGYEYS